MSAFTVHFMCSCLALAEHFEQCAEFPTLRIQNPFPSPRINRRQGSQGNHYPVTVGEMRRTPRGGQWYAKSVSNLLARA
jgi:hypothetical protein